MAHITELAFDDALTCCYPSHATARIATVNRRVEVRSVIRYPPLVCVPLPLTATPLSFSFTAFTRTILHSPAWRSRKGVFSTESGRMHQAPYESRFKGSS